MLRSRILDGTLPQGHELSQVALSEDLGVSRTPLREALRSLEAEGLVQRLPNGRLQVTPISLDDLEQLYSLRVMLEAYGTRLTVPRLSVSDLDAMEATLERMEACENSGDVEAWEEPHREFHTRLVSYSGARIEAQLRTLADSALRYRQMYVTSGPLAWAQTAVEHRAVLRACRAGDAALASGELGRHLGRTALTVMALVAPMHEPTKLRTALGLIVGGSTVSLLAEVPPTSAEAVHQKEMLG